MEQKDYRREISDARDSLDISRSDDSGEAPALPPPVPSCFKCGRTATRHGSTSAGVQRWRCKPCGKTWDSSFGRKRGGKPFREGTVERAKQLLEQGLRHREVLKILGAEGYGVSFVTVGIAAKGAAIPDCPCGRPGGHFGCCWYKYQQSPKWQAQMNRLHEKQRFLRRRLMLLLPRCGHCWIALSEPSTDGEICWRCLDEGHPTGHCLRCKDTAS